LNKIIINTCVAFPISEVKLISRIMDDTCAYVFRIVYQILPSHDCWTIRNSLITSDSNGKELQFI